MEMEDSIYNRVVSISNDAEKLLDVGKEKEAIEYFKKAYELIPKPKTDWEAGTWILTAIGDTYFSLGIFEKALEYLKNAEIHPNGIESEFLLLRIGQTYFEVGDMKNAKEYLLRVYMLSGEEIFIEEEDKYKDVIKSLIEKDHYYKS